MKTTKKLFLTGITGTLGKDMLVSLLQNTPHHLSLLVRSKPGLTGNDRIAKIFKLAGHDPDDFTDRIRIYEGDVTLPDLGLSQDDLEHLKNEIDEFFHAAALTALNGAKKDCFNINFHGTENVLNIVRSMHATGKLKRFFYFSTAFVAGSCQNYLAKEDSLPDEPAHANHYESSKYQAETLVRKAGAEGLPITIFRPSIVVGSSKDGRVSDFNVIYPFIKLFAHGLLTKLPTRGDHSCNIVPIDFVIDAALEISQQESSIGKTYHLVTENPPTVSLLLQVKDDEFSFMPDVEVIDPKSFLPAHLSPSEMVIYMLMEPYLGYLNDHLCFDMTNTKQALAGTRVQLPETDGEFIKKIVQYAIDSGYIVTGNAATPN